MNAPNLSPRAELGQITRRRILGAAADLVAAGAEDITFDAVSRASGVPLRTVYRHFPNRDVLRDAFWGWLNDAIEVPDPPRTPADLPAYGRALFAAFDRQAALVRAFIHTAAGRDIRSAGTAARQEKFRRRPRPAPGRPFPRNRACAARGRHVALLRLRLGEHARHRRGRSRRRRRLVAGRPRR